MRSRPNRSRGIAPVARGRSDRRLAGRTTCILALLGRTSRRAVAAKDAAITGARAEVRAATRAIVEEHASIARHNLCLHMTALGTRDHTDRLHSPQSKLLRQVFPFKTIIRSSEQKYQGNGTRHPAVISEWIECVEVVSLEIPPRAHSNWRQSKRRARVQNHWGSAPPIDPDRRPRDPAGVRADIADQGFAVDDPVPARGQIRDADPQLRLLANVHFRRNRATPGFRAKCNLRALPP